MSVLVWLVACNWFTSSETTVRGPVAAASVTERVAVGTTLAERPMSDEQLAALDELFVRTTELVREGKPEAFERATITFVQATLDEDHPKPGERVTVVPAAEGLAPQTMRIREVSEAELFIQLTTTSTDDAAWLAAPAPEGERPEWLGRATLIHPMTAHAKVAPAPESLPEGMAAETVVASVDVSNDGVADIVTSEHCCDDPATAPGEACDSGACIATWVRSADGWRQCEEG